MKKNSFKPAVAALLVTGLTVFGVAVPAYADAVDPIDPDVANETVEEPGLGAEDEIPEVVPTPPAEAPVDEAPVEEPTEEAPAEDDYPVDPEFDAPATPDSRVVNIGVTSADVSIATPLEGGPVTDYVVNVFNADRSIDFTSTVNSPQVVSFTGLTAETTFSVSVVATGPGGSATYSTSFSTLTAPVSVPATPVLTVVAVDTNFITVEVVDGVEAPVNEEYPTSYNLVLSNGADSVNVTLDSPGSYTFEGLTASTEYVVNANASNVAGASAFASVEVVTAAEQEADLPAPTRIDSIELTADGAIVTVSSDGVRGPIDSYSVTISGDGVDFTATSETAGEFIFGDLEAGLYSVTADATGPGGSTGVEGYFFFVPNAPAVSASFADVGPDYVLGEIRSGVTYPAVTGPLATAPLTYTVTITGGGIEETRTVTDNGTAVGGRFAFNNLTPETTYSVEIVASNVAGTQTLGLEFTTTAENQGPVTPVAPNANDLTDDNRGGITVQGTVEVGGVVTVTLDPALAGQTVYGWLYSEPTALGSAVVNADGTVSFTIPETVPAGAHRLAITTENNVLVGWGNIVVTAPDGGDTDNGTGTDNGNGTGVDNGTGTDANGGVTTARGTDGELATTGGGNPLGFALAAILMMGFGVFFVARRKIANQQ